MGTICENLANIRQRMAAAAERAGRDLSDIELLAVSKTFPPEDIQEAVDSGQTLFGENKVQEALSKISLLPPTLRWHLIGQLQSNKIRKILPHVEVIHSVDSLKLASDVNRIATELGLQARIYLEVNVGNEDSKHGFSPENLRSALPQIQELGKLQLQGLMCIPPFTPEVEDSRPFFRALRTLRDELQNGDPATLPQLSMGMSHDFEVAIEEGSNIVRVGSAIFGGRTPKANAIL
jgi:PLP dependent protein